MKTENKPKIFLLGTESERFLYLSLLEEEGVNADISEAEDLKSVLEKAVLNTEAFSLILATSAIRIDDELTLDGVYDGKPIKTFIKSKSQKLFILCFSSIPEQRIGANFDFFVSSHPKNSEKVFVQKIKSILVGK